MTVRLRTMTGDLVEERRVPKDMYHIWRGKNHVGAFTTLCSKERVPTSRLIDPKWDIPPSVTTRPEYVCERCWLEFVKVTP